MADIPADADGGKGAWEELRGHDSGAALSVALVEAAQRHHGTAATAFINAILNANAGKAALATEIKKQCKSFTKEALPADASGQAWRVAGRFALVAVAGELTNPAMRILPHTVVWPIGWRNAAVRVIRNTRPCCRKCGNSSSCTTKHALRHWGAPSIITRHVPKAERGEDLIRWMDWGVKPDPPRAVLFLRRLHSE